MPGTPTLGEIYMFAGNFAPNGYALCNGQLLPISQNAALSSILGTTYGGNGVSNFALPNLQGRVPIHAGTGAGSTFVLGEAAGVENVTLTSSQIPSHNHSLACQTAGGDQASPSGHLLATDGTGNALSYATTANATLAAGAVGTAGGSQPHTNVQPFLAINFTIALVGIFPSRN